MRATYCLKCSELMPYVLFALCEACTKGMTVREVGLLQRALLADDAPTQPERRLTMSDERFERKYPDVARQERDDELTNRFTYHAPLPGQPELYEQIRTAGLEFARLLNAYCPSSRELSSAISSVDQAVMWANAAIARER